MAWTAPRTWTTGELVTAAFMNTHVRDNLNYLKSTGADSDLGSRTFTNTGFLDLDALTGGAGSITAVAATVDTDTLAIVHIGASISNAAASFTVVSYRVSGATTTAAADDWAFNSSAGNFVSGSKTSTQVLTAGSNTFEAQARVSAGTGTIADVYLVVEPK
jgi:hypothetical protein